MPTEILMPRMGWDMKVGSVAEWVKREGDEVSAGDVICLISGDKATTELEAPEPGRLHVPAGAPSPGVDVPVGTVIAYLLAPGETAPEQRRVVATPRARRAAKALGLDWRTLAGTGRGGRILERDVQKSPPPEAPALTGIRRLTAERMEQSARTVAPVTLTTEADASALASLRQQAGAEQQHAPSIIDLLVRITALALVEHPALNASSDDVHVAIAVDTDNGLVAPVIRDAQTRSVGQISREARRLIEAARAGRLAPEDLRDASFTITNLGMYDIDAFTPIVNLPQRAILGVGRIIARPIVTDETTEKIEVRRMLALSLTFDHRLVDGAPAARFLQRIKHLIERPTLWLFS
jgi:pyruvate dehydrogenase E2 component (dihydrolipoamide acetyltransferase)